MACKKLMGAGRRRSSSLAPDAVTGLQGWWDMSVAASLIQDRANVDPTLADDDGEPIGTIRDQSGNGRHLQAVTGDINRPTYKPNQQNSLPGALFDAVDDYWRCDAIATSFMSGTDQPFSIVWVGRQTSTSGNRSFWGCNNSADADSLHRFRCNGTTSYHSDRRDNGSTSVSVSGGTPNTSTRVFALTFSGTTVSLWINGVAVFTDQAQNVGAVTLTSFSVGAWFRNAGGEVTEELLAGYFFEMAFYNADIGSSNALAVSSYMQTKWAVS